MKNTHKVLAVIAIGFMLYFLIPLFTAILTFAAVVCLALWCFGIYNRNFRKEKSRSRWS